MTYKECAEFLKKRDDFLVVTHKNPDGDCMGSAAALCSALRRAGKRAYLYPNSQVIAVLRPYVEPFYASENFVPGCIVAVDTATENMFALGFEGAVELCIDHHPSNSSYADKLLLQSQRSSCGEIVLELIKALRGNITREEADLLYIAVSTDTGCFVYSNTNAATFRAAAELMKAGADNHTINTAFFRKRSLARLRLEAMLYSGMQIHRDGKLIIASVTKEMMEKAGATEDDLDDIAGLAGRVEGSVLSVTIRETDDGGSKLSLRSNHEVNSCDICAVFGGGGHAMAAGCSLACAPDKAAVMIKEVIDEVWK